MGLHVWHSLVFGVYKDTAYIFPGWVNLDMYT